MLIRFVAWAKLTQSLFKVGEVDSCDDIRAMARPDTIWSISIVSAVCCLVRHFAMMRREVGTVDVYFDTRSLKADHAAALQGALKQLLRKAAKLFASERGMDRVKHLRVRHVRPVEKAKDKEKLNKFQLGTWLSDRLCAKSSQLFKTNGASRIKVVEMSNVVSRTAQQWEGKSFYE